jgi:ABC-2 type transport system permease protein
MNANSTSIATHTPLSKFMWLVKREFWEYRGAFLRTPLIIAMVMLVLMVGALVIAELTAQRAGVTMNGIHLDQIANNMSAAQIDKFHAGVSMGLMSLCFPIGIGLFFVLFSYATGALYNDRADRSVLFWKSLPISDSQTVLAKVFTAMFVAPALAIIGVIALQLGFLILMSLWIVLHGMNPLPLWAPMHLAALWVKLLVLIPLNALWALPTLGWLLLVSSFVRSKPFLWALMLPFVAGFLVSAFKLSQELSLSSTWFWHNVVLRVVFSFIPSWMDLSQLKALDHDDRLPEAVSNLLSFDAFGQVLVSPDLWIGAVAGVAMIAGAVYFRRQRTESYA